MRHRALSRSGARRARGCLHLMLASGRCISCSLLLLGLYSSPEGGEGALSAGDFLVLPDLTYLQFSAMDALAGMMMKGAAKCDKHAE